MPEDAHLVALGLGGDAFQVELLHDLVDPPCVVGRDPGLQGDVLADGRLGGLFDLAVGEGLQRHLAADELLLEHLGKGAQAVLGGGVEDDLVRLELERGAGVLEVEPRRDLAGSLVDGVAHFLVVDLGGDVEARHGPHATGGGDPPPDGCGVRRPAHRGGVAIGYPRRFAGRYPSGQRGQTVNLLALPT